MIEKRLQFMITSQPELLCGVFCIKQTFRRTHHNLCQLNPFSEEDWKGLKEHITTLSCFQDTTTNQKLRRCLKIGDSLLLVKYK
jgi:hypothetical protein